MHRGVNRSVITGRLLVDHAREPEIGHANAAVGVEQQIARGDVAVHDASSVQCS